MLPHMLNYHTQQLKKLPKWAHVSTRYSWLEIPVTCNSVINTKYLAYHLPWLCIGSILAKQSPSCCAPLAVTPRYLLLKTAEASWPLSAKADSKIKAKTVSTLAKLLWMTISFHEGWCLVQPQKQRGNGLSMRTVVTSPAVQLFVVTGTRELGCM